MENGIVATYGGLSIQRLMRHKSCCRALWGRPRTHQSNMCGCTESPRNIASDARVMLEHFVSFKLLGAVSITPKAMNTRPKHARHFKAFSRLSTLFLKFAGDSRPLLKPVRTCNDVSPSSPMVFTLGFLSYPFGWFGIAEWPCSFMRAFAPIASGFSAPC